MSLTSAQPVPVAVTGRTSHRLTPVLRMILALVLTILGATVASVAAAPAASAASGRATDFDTRMLLLVNDARDAAGLPDVQGAVGLTNLSLWWSTQLADGATDDVLQHNPNAFQQTLSYGASNRTSWGENVAKWSPTSISADSIFAAYMNSPGHRANILGANYRFIGIASTTGSTGISYNTMTFTDRVDPGQVYTTPSGSTDQISVADGVIKVGGWAYDPNSNAASIPIQVFLNGAYNSTFTANGVRADVNSAFGVTGKHGFVGSVPAVNGKNTVCVFALSITGAGSTLMLCKDLTWNPVRPPVGSFDAATLSGSTIRFSGWTFDPGNSRASNSIRVTLNGASGGTYTANAGRSDVNSAFGLSGDHGFSGNLTAKSGANQVCVTAVTVGAANTADLGCKTVNYVAPGPAVGSIDAVTRNGNTVSVNGWAYDPAAKGTSTPVHVYVNGAGTALTANKSRTDVNNVFGLTGNHGYLDSVTVGSGPADVCLFAISISGGDNTLLGCRTLAAPPAATGSLDLVSRTAGGISVSGWAFDPATSSSANQVHVYVNGAGAAQIGTNVQRQDVNQAFGITGTHGFSSVVPTSTTGALSVCVFSISISGGDNSLLGCRTV